MKRKVESARDASIKTFKIIICLIVVLILIVSIGLACFGIVAHISPPSDNIDSFDYPSAFFCESAENRIDYQKDGKCAAYASAYVMRHFGEDTDGEKLYSELKRSFGFVSANSVVDVFERHGYQAKACRGSIDTLKQRLTEGNPIIVFIQIPDDTHYAVVVGYDEDHVYLADSLRENANVSGNRYNRAMTTEEFVSVWKTKTILPDNIYIRLFKESD